VTRARLVFSALLLFLAVLLSVFVFWPEMDLALSGVFAHGTAGFYWQGNAFLTLLSRLVYYGSRGMALFFVAALIVSLWQRKEAAGLSARAWLFLLLALLIGPGLIVNFVFKDHWGRARPKQIVAFGGDKPFTPAFVVSNACQHNCSFVSGDAAFGFFLPSFAYVVARRRRRAVFWSAMGLGSVIASARLFLGAHFMSDILGAALVSLLTSFALHALLFRLKETQAAWQEWFSLSPRACAVEPV